MMGYHNLWQMQQGITRDPDSKELYVTKYNIAIILAKLEQMVKKN